jgi:nucleoside recognition membrane protein YjiH
MLNDEMNLVGELHIVLTAETGEVKKDVVVPNLVVSVGKNFVASALIASSPTPFSNMAVGTGTTTPALGDTTLTSELYRNAFNPAASTSGNVATFTGTYGAGVATGALTEAGLFNSATSGAGTMMSHVTFAVVNKAATDSLTITWTITCG